MDTSPSAPGEDIIIKRSESDEAGLASQEDELAVNEDEEEMQVDSVMPSEVDENGNHAVSDDAGEGDELQSDKEDEEGEAVGERLVDLFFLSDGGLRSSQSLEPRETGGCNARGMLRSCCCLLVVHPRYSRHGHLSPGTGQKAFEPDG
jgi:hypothetical protein